MQPRCSIFGARTNYNYRDLLLEPRETCSIEVIDLLQIYSRTDLNSIGK